MTVELTLLDYITHLATAFFFGVLLMVLLAMMYWFARDSIVAEAKKEARRQN